jgi:hypothetical protein
LLLDDVAVVIELVDDDAAVGSCAVGEERVNLTNAGAAQELVDRVVNLLTEPKLSQNRSD